jgi:hypothetical protein
MLIWFGFSFVMAFVVGAIGQSRGGGIASFAGWFLFGFLIWPIALIAVCLKPNRNRKCPACFSSIPKAATKCRYCQTDISDTSEPPGFLRRMGVPIPTNAS